MIPFLNYNVQNRNSLICILLIVLLVFSPNRVSAQAIKDLFDEAAQAFYGGNYDQAIKNYEKIIELEPNFAPAYNALGLALKIRGASNDEVIYYFTKAIELDPNFLASYDNLGKLYYSEGDVDRAQEYFEKGLALDPNSESMILSVGWIYLLGRSDPDNAIKYFRKVTTNNGSAMGYFGEGICLMANKKRMEVMDIVTKLRSINQEGLAQDLEVMLRENRSLIRQAEFPTAASVRTVVSQSPAQEQPRPATVSGNSPSSPRSDNKSFSEFDENGELRVRLLDKLPTQ